MDELIADVIGGSIDLDAGREIARNGARRGAITSDSVMGALHLRPNDAPIPASYQESGWRGLRASRELAYEAARSLHEVEAMRAMGRRDTPFTHLWLLAGYLLLQSLAATVGDGADLRLLLRAEEVAQETLGASEGLSYPENRGLLLLEHGRFHLLSHTTNRVPGGPTDASIAWLDKPLQERDLGLLEVIHRDTGTEPGNQEWPDPDGSIDLAERRLREALPLVPDQFRLRTLLDLVSAMEWRWRCECEIDIDELRNFAQQALELLDPDDLLHRLQLMATLSNHGVEPDLTLISSLEENWEAYVARRGEGDAWAAVHQAAYLLAQRDPARALRLLGRRHELRPLWEEEAMVSLHLSFELQLFAQSYGPYSPAKAGSELERAAQGALLLARLGRTPFGARAAAAALAGTIAAALALDRLSVGLRMSDALEPLDSSLWSRHRPAITYLIAKLRRREATLHADDPVIDGAVQLYCDAAIGFGQLKMRVEANRCIALAGDLVGSEREFSSAVQLAVWLARYSHWFEVLAPSSAPDLIQRLAMRLFARLLVQGAQAEPMQLLIGVIKGRRYAAMLAQPPHGLETSSKLDDLLRLEALAETPVGAQIESDLSARSELDDYVLAAWVNDYERDAADTPAARLAGVQRAIERDFWAAKSLETPGDVPQLADLFRGLDDQTALLQLVEGVTRDGRIAIHQILLAQERVAATIIDGPEERTLRISDAFGRRILHTPLAWPVIDFRRTVQEDPGPLDLAPEGREQIDALSHAWLSVVLTERGRLQEAGIENLIIVPHGPAHYLPFHLLGDDEGPLAEQFVVSQLLHVSQIDRSVAESRQKEGIGIFGLSYADQSGFAVLDDSYEECMGIAETCETSPLMDQAATPEAFKAALESCRYVHLRAHGRANADAPSLHTVFLHPGVRQDGRLRAYEIGALDLSGLELVTLGACETGLGRVDQFDNPRGFPAMLMLAGAKAVIGTLWPTIPAASRFFFRHLYEKLMGSPAGQVRSCFQSARLATRGQYPQYRDWGTFYLIGGLGKGRE